MLVVKLPNRFPIGPIPVPPIIIGPISVGFFKPHLAVLFSILEKLISSSVAVVCVAFLILLVGCKEQPQIVTHRIPKSRSGLENLRNEKVDVARGSTAPASSFATPEGWTRGKSNPMFPSDKFLKTVNDSDTVMSIMSLPASNDWQSNVQRWLGQVGLEKSAEEIEEMTTKVEVDGISSTRIRLVKDDADSQAIVGIMAVKGNLAWFIKLAGKKAAVEVTEDEFDGYVKTLKLP